MTEFTLTRKRVDWRKACAFVMAVCITLSSLNLSGAVVFAASKDAKVQQVKGEIALSSDVEVLSSDEEALSSDEEGLYVKVLSRSTIEAKVGGKAEFCVSATSPLGNENITYQWYKKNVKDSNEIKGATSSKLQFASINDEDFATYYCVVKDGRNTITKRFYLDKKYELSVTTSSWNYVYVLEGTSTKLKVSAQTTGNEPIKYSWSKWDYETGSYKEIPSESTNTLLLSKVTSDTYGKYKCTVSSGTEVQEVQFYVYVSSNLSVRETIYRDVKKGQTVTLDPYAYTLDGSEITYQWIKQTGDVKEELKGETKSTLVIDSVTENDETAYSCKVTAGSESKVVNFELYVSEPEFAYGEITWLYRTVGQDATLKVIPYGEKEYAYQWYKECYFSEDGEDRWEKINGATSAEYAVSDIAQEDFGNYRCEVSYGKQTQKIYIYLEELWNSNQFNLEYRRNYYLGWGETATIGVKVNNCADYEKLQYKWYKTSLDNYEYELIEGADGPECEVTFPTKKEWEESYYYGSVEYRCEVTNTETNQTEYAYIDISNKNTLSVNSMGGYNILLGSSVTLAVDAETITNNPITYQWYKKDEKIEGATEREYTVNANSEHDFGEYRCEVSDGVNTEKRYYDVYRETALSYYTPCNTFNKSVGDSVTMEVIASGYNTQPVTYQWMVRNLRGSWRVIDGATESSYTINSLKQSDLNMDYRCIITNGRETDECTFYINERYQDPEEHLSAYIKGTNGSTYKEYSAYQGQKFDIEVEAYSNLGEDAISYQWSKYDYDKDVYIPLTGENNKSLSFESYSFNQYGRYECKVTAGTQTEYIEIRIDTDSCLYFEVNDTYHWAYYNEAVTLVANAKSDNPQAKEITYQWYRYNNETDQKIKLENETSSKLTIQHLTESGRYYCEAFDGFEYASMSAYAECRSKLTITYGDNMEYWDLYIYEGQDIELTTKVFYKDEIVEPSSYQWYYLNAEDEKVKITENGNEATLTVKNIQQESPRRYVCEVTYQEETAQKTYDIQLYNDLEASAEESEMYVQLGKPVSMKAVASSHSGKEIRYQWYMKTRSGEWSKIDGATSDVYSKDAVKEIDYRDYKCLVSTDRQENEVWFSLYDEEGKQYDAAFLEVERVGNNNTYCYLGNRVSLEVDATSNRVIHYQWYKYDEKTEEYIALESQTNNTLVIDKMTESEFGEYQCVVTAGNMENYVYFNVIKATGDYICNQQEEKVFAEAGQEAVLKALVTSDKEISYKWYKLDEAYNAYKVIPNTKSEYALSNISKEDFGTYACEYTVGDNSDVILFKVVNLSYSSELPQSEHEYSNDLDQYFAYYNEAYKGASKLAVTFDKKTAFEEGCDYIEIWDANNNKKRYSSQRLAGKTIYVDGDRFVLRFSTDGSVTDWGFAVTSITPVTIENPEETKKPVTDIELTKQTITLALNESETLKPLFAPVNPTNKNVVWETKDPSIATVDANGKVTAVGVGTTTVIATSEDGNYEAKCSVTVFAKVSGVTLNKTSMKVFEGSTEALTATVMPENAENKNVTWTSSNNDVASVDGSGKVTAKKAGTATITVRTEDGNHEAKCTVTVFVHATGVTLNKTAVTVKQGSTETLSAWIMPANALNKEVSWSSSDNAIAKVDQWGKVTAVKPGTATITVTTKDGNKTASCKVTVTSPATKVQLSKTSLALNKGASSVLSATITPSNSTDRITWSSSNQNVAKVDQSGKVVAVNPGTADITAKSTSGVQATCKVTVNQVVTKPATTKPVVAKSIKLNKTKATLNVSKSVTLKATITPTNAAGKVTWSSSNKKIATVSSKGVVKALKPGTVTITATTSNKKKATCKVTVKQPAKKVVLNKKTATLKKGKTLQLKATITPSNSTDQLVWSTSNKKIATVSKNGKVKAVKKGTVTITVKTSSGKKATCKITIK